jgi:hypothetical protein
MLLPWQIKVAGFKLMSLLPAGELLYQAVQQHLTRSTVPTPPTVQQKLEVGRAYLNLLEKFDRQELLAHATHIDIGCGWMPTIPLLFYALGCDHQLLCDVRRNFTAVTVRGTVEIVRRLLSGPLPYAGLPPRRLPPPFPPGGEAEDYLASLGMSYVAPYRLEDLVRPSPLLVTCTQVLIYLAPSAVRELLLALAGTLTAGDLFIVGVKCYDLYSDCDPGLSPYNKWTYSPLVWESFINSRLMSFNRLTAADYQRLLLECGFQLLFFEQTGPTPAELEGLRGLRIHASFQHVPREELAAKEFLAVASGSPASGRAKP